MPAIGRLSHYEAKHGQEYWKLYLNKVATDALGGARFVRVLKTDRHIILEPVAENAEGVVHKTATNINKGLAQISLNGMVASGFIPKRWFGKKYKVKRQTAKGLLFVCIEEELTE